MSYGRMTHATIEEQLTEARRLQRQAADHQRRAELEETRAAHAAASAKLVELTKTN